MKKQSKIHARKSDAKNIENNQQWPQKRIDKHQQSKEKEIEQMIEKRGSAEFGTEDPDAQETHLNSRLLTHLKIPKEKIKLRKMKFR